MLTNTKHSPSCNMAFGRKDANCPRCQELLKGAPAREGWQGKYFSRKAEQEALFRRSLATHNCKSARCAIVCTFGDW